MMDAPCSRFTAAEGGARLAVSAADHNTLAIEYASFISTRMIYEDAYKIRGCLSDGFQRSVYVTRASRVEVVAYELNILTDLSVAREGSELADKQVLVCVSSVLRQILEDDVLNMTNINILILDSCHLINKDDNLKFIMKLYKECDVEKRPRILALTYPLFSSPKRENANDSKADEIAKPVKDKKIDETDDNVSKTDATIDDIPSSCKNLTKCEGGDGKDDKNLQDEEDLPAITEKLLISDRNIPKILEIEDLRKPEVVAATELKAEEVTENIPSSGDILPSTENLPKIVEIKDLVPVADVKSDVEQAKIAKKKEIDSKNVVKIEPIGVYENLDDFNMYEKLEWKIEQLESELCCQMDLAEDIDGGKRLSANITKPRELIIEYGPQPSADKLSPEYIDLEVFMKDTVKDAVEFLDEHRYDPTEIYGEDLYEEFMNIPNPTIDPKQIFHEFLYILEQLGPYAADKAAFSLLTKLEKLKIKVPYERHFLLLCLCTSVFVKIRCYADLVFSNYESDWLKIQLFSTPKVLRFAEILEKFAPSDQNKSETLPNDQNATKTQEMLQTLESCDFLTLSNKIEDKVNTMEANLKDIDDNCVNNESKCQSTLGQQQNECSDVQNESNSQNDPNNFHNGEQRNVLGFSRRTGHRTRGRGRAQRPAGARAQQMLQNPDALCGIVFVKEPLMAKIMFMLIVDMSRCHPSLSYLCAQYCAVEGGGEPRECQRRGKQQEGVLKKFRMHECNLLLATSALEEGIDLPRCNLVLRWDIPASYRSYGLCRARARAPRCACAVLSRGAAHVTDVLLHHVAVYTELDQLISRKCGCGIQNEPPQSEEDHADSFTRLVKPYTPRETAHEDKKSDHNHHFRCEREIKTCINEIDDGESVLCDKSNSVLNNDDYNHSRINSDDINDSSKNSDDKINSILNNDDTQSNDENLVCNICNKKRESVNIECPCVSDKNRNDNLVNKDDDVKCDEVASVDLSTAIALINRYCGKLPSDTFTRLAPQWWMEEVQLSDPEGHMRTAYICTLRLPLNCPVKYNIVGHPMPTRVLARRMAALQACRILHKSGELDNQLMPIGKENFKACELDPGGNLVDSAAAPADAARPGTTKRRQYYYKRTAWAFTDCQPVLDTSDAEIDPPEENTEETQVEPKVEVVKKTGTKRNMLYAIVSKLWCALPERYNTRGRRLHAPQNASQAIGILMARDEPDSLQIPAFPVYTRSGEVRVSVEYVPDADVRMSPRRGRLVRRFMRFVFAEVLRVRRRGMRLQSEGSTHNNYYIVPTVKTIRDDGSTKIDIDWAFLALIYQHTEDKKHSEIERPNLWLIEDEDEGISVKEVKKSDVKKMANPLLKEGETFVFDAEKYREAVVTPWYRNQDQPQFFLVAEICWSLSPDSAFPSASHPTFRQYYRAKYGAALSTGSQPLLDVDHTSNRLNLLTPRYVNRKGVALPVSSERTRRAKRDRLDQKQILVPELCRVHPFPAELWFATVALPCVLYRINALLIADEIRRSVAIDVGLGIPKIDESTCPGFQWPPLDFGWSLAEVLSADSEKNKKEEEESKKQEQELNEKEQTQKNQEDGSPREEKEKTINDILQEKEATEDNFEIGTWSNDMASSIPQEDEYMEPLPSNLTFCTSASGGTNWCDPIEKPKSQFQPSHKYSMADSDCSYTSSEFDTDDSDLNSEGSDDDTESSGFFSSKNSNAAMGVRIEYKTAHEAEAVDLEGKKKVNPAPQPDEEDDLLDRRTHEEFIKDGEAPREFIEKFHESVAKHRREILANGYLIKYDQPLKEILPETKESQEKSARIELESKKELRKELTEFQRWKELAKDAIKNNVDEELLKKLSETSIIENEILPDRRLLNAIHKSDTQELLKSPNELIFNSQSNSELEELTNRITNIDLKTDNDTELIKEVFPFGIDVDILGNGQIDLENIERNKRILLSALAKSLPQTEIKKLNCFSMIDVDIDSPTYVNEKIKNVGFDSKETYVEKVNKFRNPDDFKPYYLDSKESKQFDFDYQPRLDGHPGPSPSVILQALTMSNANDGINLERLETIGDSFLKFAITAYLYCAHPTVHEGKLSHMRSKQVSNLNLYRLGRNKRLGTRMIASKFEPHDNWLPPCHKPPSTLHPRMNDAIEQSPLNTEVPPENTGCFIPYNLITQHSIPDKSIADCVEALIGAYLLECGPRGALLFMSWLGIRVLPRHDIVLPHDHPYVAAEGARHERERAQKPRPPPTPRKYDVTDSDSASSSDEEWCEQLEEQSEQDWSWQGRPLGSLRPHTDSDGKWVQTIFGELKAPPSPLLRYIADPEGELERMLSGYDALERTLQYRFRDRSLLLQALTHASHQQNRLTDCYQRLEFLGDAILDYLITRHLYEDPRRHSPGALTDLRSALVNNTIFATLAARHGFHKYFRHMSPGLNEVLTKYVKIQEENGHSISEEHYLIQEDEMEQAEDVEVPKALGDLFESVAGAIFLDSGMSLGAVWNSYVTLMGAELEAFSAAAPKSPVRELLEAEPDTAKFGKPERLADGRRVRVCVEVFGRGAFKGVGRNYRIAKGTAARCALRHLKIHRQR